METATLMMLGTGLQAGGKIAGGISAQEAGDYNAAALKRQATDEIAGAQRQAIERRRETDRVISTQITRAASSGAGFGPSLLDVIGDTAERGEYQAQADMYGGRSRAANLRDRAALARHEGDSAFAGSLLEGVGGLAIGAGRYDYLYGTRKPSIPAWRTTVSYG
jgi:hypothetical protein